MRKFKKTPKETQASLSFSSNLIKEHHEMITATLNPMKGIHESLALTLDPLKEYRETIASISNPMEDIRASLSFSSDLFKEHRKMITATLNPEKGIHESLSLTLDPFKEYRETIASISNPMEDIRASLSFSSDLFKKNHEMITATLNPMKGIHKSLAPTLDPLKEYRETMASISKPMKDFQASLTSVSDTFSNIQKSITNNTSLKLIRDIALESHPKITINKDNVISLSSKRIAATEIQELSDKIFHDSSKKESNSLEDIIENLLDEIRNIKDPLLQKILINLLYPLIISIIVAFITPIADHHIKSYINSDKRILKKELNSRINPSIHNKNILKSIRYVSADILHVRASASAKAKSIGYLYFSDIALILDKKKNWTLIEWNDPENNTRITGWVFSRYLTKFKP